MVLNPANAYHWVAVSGTGELTTDGADAHIDSLSNKFLGKDYPYRQPGEQRVTVQCAPGQDRGDRLRRLTTPERPDTIRQEVGMKNAEKPKKMQKKVAQKTLKEKRSEKKAKEQAR